MIERSQPRERGHRVAWPAAVRLRPLVWPFRRGVPVLPLLLMPAAALLLGFVYWPLAQVLLLSLFQWNLISPQRTFVGLGNYASLLTDPTFGGVLVQSIGYVVAALLGNFLLPLGLALLTLQVGPRARSLYQALLFTPTVVATSVGALLWQWIYLPSGGLVNALLGQVGIPPVNWLNSATTVLPAIGVVAAWKYLGFNYLAALAGLVALPRDYLEAARVDGAAGGALLRSIIVPLLAPTLLFLALTTILQTLPNAFVPIQIMTRGGPNNASNNLLYDVYQTAFQFFQVGRASAEAVVLILLLGGAAIWQFRLLDRRIEYDR